MNAPPRRATTRTVFLQAEVGVKTARLAAVTRMTNAETRVTDVSRLMLSQPCNRPTAKTRSALGAVLAIFDTSVPMRRRTTVVVRTAAQRTARKMMATFARHRVSAAKHHRLSRPRLPGRPLDGRSARMMASPGHDKLEHAPAGDASLPRHPLISIGKERTARVPVATFDEWPLKNGHLMMQFSSV